MNAPRHSVREQSQSAQDVSRKLDEITQELRQSHQNVRQVTDELSRLRGLKGNDGENFRQANELAKSLWQSDWQPESNTTPFDPSIAKGILDSLYFSAIDYRGDAIPVAYEETYGWIFVANDESPSAPSHEFPSWLQAEGRDIFWITGKPGSGKSTLMKFLVQHPDLKRHLGQWAGTRKLLIADYFFWDGGGDSLQKSREGMLRTLLHRCLVRFPHLARAASPRRYALYEAFEERLIDAPPWTLSELLETFTRLVRRCGSTFRLALFVDGLDEFSGDATDLITFIKDLNDKLDVKICVSSRPWIEFSEVLAQSPKITMQNFTAGDIERFIDGNFSTCKGYLERNKISPDETKRFRLEILRRADGVFLWVSLVVKMLIRAFTKGSAWPRLLSILDTLPSELSALYTRLWKGIDTADTDIASKYLLLKLHSKLLSTTLLWLADGERLPKDFSESKLSLFFYGNRDWGVDEHIHRRLDSYTRGMLTLHRRQGIYFVHRSARDWALTPDVKSNLHAALGSDFDPNLILLEALSSYITKALQYCTAFGATDRRFLREGMRDCFFYAAFTNRSSSTNSRVVHLLEKLERSAKIPASSFPRDDKLRVTLHYNVGIAASLAVLPYIQAKTSANPSVVGHWCESKISILSIAATGFESIHSGEPFLSTPSRLSYRIFKYQPSNGNIEEDLNSVWRFLLPDAFDYGEMLERRLHLVAFLADQGVTRRKWKLFERRTALCEHIQQLKDRDDLQAMEREYFEKVLQILKPPNSVKGSLARRPRLPPRFATRVRDAVINTEW
jgi:hypothetical protein